jgi:hypothetical protein
VAEPQFVLVEEDEDVASVEARLFAKNRPPEPLDETPDEDVAPDPVPADPDPVPDPVFRFETPTVQDIDRLWDWIRSDGPATMAKYQVDSSVGLHQMMGQVMQMCQAGTAILQSVWTDQGHVGFIGVGPIQQAQGRVHIFVSPAVRGRSFTALARAALTELQTQYPALQIFVSTDDVRMMRFARRVGFTQTQYVMTPPREA